MCLGGPKFCDIFKTKNNWIGGPGRKAIHAQNYTSLGSILTPSTAFALKTILSILHGMDSSRRWKHSWELLVHVDMPVSCKFYVCELHILQISDRTTTQRCFMQSCPTLLLEICQPAEGANRLSDSSVASQSWSQLCWSGAGSSTEMLLKGLIICIRSGKLGRLFQPQVTSTMSHYLKWE